MRITFVTRKFGNVERNSHCDVLHITPIRVAILFLDCNGDFAIKDYRRQKMQLFTQRRASVLWVCKCSSDKQDNINVKQRDGRAFTTSKRNIFIDIWVIILLR